MTPAFWDTSALVPLCVRRQSSPAVRLLFEKYLIVVWWATPVEMRSAFERLSRIGELSIQQHAEAGQRFDTLRQIWREMQPSESLRSQAEMLMTSYPLKAADSLQLAAAWVWSSGFPQSRTFLSGDAQLLEAARQVGFQVVAV